MYDPKIRRKLFSVFALTGFSFKLAVVIILKIVQFLYLRGRLTNTFDTTQQMKPRNCEMLQGKDNISDAKSTAR